VSRDYPRIDPADHERILREEVLRTPDFLGATSQERPRAILLAGQPGSGKGGLSQVAQMELGGDVVVIDPDAERRFHPGFRSLPAGNPYEWSGDTHRDASQWADEKRMASVDGRKNFILDTTLSDGAWTSELIDDLRAKGYDVEVRAVVAHRLESELGVDQRFAKQLDGSGVGRHVPEGVRTNVYDKLPTSLDTVAERTGVQIRLYSREGVELYDSRTSAVRPGEALIAEREARMRDPAIVERTRQGWSAQQEWHRDLPENLARNPRVSGDTAQRLLEQRAELKVVENVERNASTVAEIAYTRVAGVQRSGPGMTRLGVAATGLGAALTVADGVESGQRAASLYERGNATGAQSELIHFTTRNVGAWGGAALGAGLGAAGTSWSGPGAVIGGIVGGAAGLVGGEKVADYLDHRRIYRQADADGKTWAFDPEKPAHGWRRTETIEQVAANGRVVEQSREVVASGPLAAQLDRQATTVSLELMLARPPVPKDPYTLPSGPGDATSIPASSWQRDPATGDWTRRVYEWKDDGTELGRSELRETVTADAARAAQLEAASQAILRENVHLAPAAMAARFELAHRDKGWDRIGPLPESAQQALRDDGRLVASDGAEYQRQQDGGWQRQALFGMTTADASPKIASELDATRGLLQEGLREHRALMAERPQPAPLTFEQTMADAVTRAYAREGLTRPADEVQAMAQAMVLDHRARGLDGPYLVQLERDPATKQVGPESPMGLYTRGADGDMALRFTMTPTEARELLARPPSPAPSDPLNEAMRGHVHTMDRAMGRTPDDASDRVAAALYAECRANGLTRVDGVVLGQKGGSAQPGEYVFAYSGSSERPSDWVGVKTAEAVQTPVEQSLAKAETLQREQAMEARQVAQVQQQAADAPRMTMG